jgi:hypothetical protein
MECDKPSSPAPADATAKEGSSPRVTVHAVSPKGGSRIQLQLTLYTDDSGDETGTHIVTLQKDSQRIAPLGLTHAASVL